jgi:hypothetical protein
MSEFSNTTAAMRTNGTANRPHIVLPVVTTLTSVIGLIFTLLCFIRYVKVREMRNHFSYMFHVSLIYCLLSGLVVVPKQFIGYYFTLFEDNRLYCHLYYITITTVVIAMPSSVAWAIIERNIFIFQINRELSLQRQVLPNIIIFSYSLTSSLLLILVPQCRPVGCSPCFYFKAHLVLIWSSLRLFLPVAIMIFSTLMLLYRLHLRQQGTKSKGSDTNTKSNNWGRPMKRIAVQSIIYFVWCVCYGSISIFYNLLTSIDSKKYKSTFAKNLSTIVGIVGVQTYPILTFLLHRPKKREQSTGMPSGKSGTKYTLKTISQNGT